MTYDSRKDLNNLIRVQRHYVNLWINLNCQLNKEHGKDLVCRHDIARKN